MVIIMNNIEYLQAELGNAIDAYQESQQHLQMLAQCHQSQDIVEERAEINKQMHSICMAIDLTEQLLLTAENKERGVA